MRDNPDMRGCKVLGAGQQTVRRSALVSSEDKNPERNRVFVFIVLFLLFENVRVCLYLCEAGSTSPYFVLRITMSTLRFFMRFSSVSLG